MPIEIWTKDKQAFGAFADGEIIENKPIGFSSDGGLLKPYSNLFYWANAESEHGGLIAEHPHKGFEIMSFVMKGSIEHYDSYHLQWKKLTQGDAQIIRAGRGISHAERLSPGSQMFQIWFDPSLEKTILKSASYDDYKFDQFPVVYLENYLYKVYIGDTSPVKLDSEGIEVIEYFIQPYETIEFNLNDDKILSAYVVQGKFRINSEQANEHDFIRIENEKNIKIETDESVRLFVVMNPAKLTYRTYKELVQEKAL